MLEIKNTVDGNFTIVLRSVYEYECGYITNFVQIAHYLDLDSSEYLNILFSHGARYTYESGLYIFKKEQDVKQVIEKLNSHIIMRKLSG